MLNIGASIATHNIKIVHIQDKLKRTAPTALSKGWESFMSDMFKGLLQYDQFTTLTTEIC